MRKLNSILLYYTILQSGREDTSLSLQKFKNTTRMRGFETRHENSIFAAYVTGNRPEGSPIRSVIMGAIWIELDDSMFNYRLITKSQFRRKEQWKKREFALKDWQRRLKFFNVAPKLTKNQNKMDSWLLSDGWLWLVDLNYNFECDWFIEQSDNNLASKLVENSFLKPVTIEEIVIFMINWVNMPTSQDAVINCLLSRNQSFHSKSKV